MSLSVEVVRVEVVSVEVVNVETEDQIGRVLHLYVGLVTAGCDLTTNPRYLLHIRKRVVILAG